MTNETEHRNPIEVLCEEFLDRRRRGESLSVTEFANLHPKFSVKIRRLFPAMLALESCKSSQFSNSTSTHPVDLDIEGLEQLGDFRIVCEIGRGGMGVVYEAEQQSLQRRVAVKVFPRQALPDSKHLDRFHREAKTAARLHHTNIVPVFGVGQQDDLHYYVMQRIVGTSLDQVIQRCARNRKQNPSDQRAPLEDGVAEPRSDKDPARSDTDRPEETEPSIARPSDPVGWPADLATFATLAGAISIARRIASSSTFKFGSMDAPFGSFRPTVVAGNCERWHSSCRRPGLRPPARGAAPRHQAEQPVTRSSRRGLGH